MFQSVSPNGRVLARGRALKLSSCVLALGALSASTAQAAAVSSFEAESATLGAAQGYPVSDTAASGGKALKIWGNDTATRRLDLAAGSDLVIRGRGDQCQGAPNLVVKLDGKQVLSTPVSSTGFADVRATVKVTAGTHSVAVAMSNNLVAGGCDRNLYIDKVTVAGAAAAPAPSPTPAPAPPSTSGKLLFDAAFKLPLQGPNPFSDYDYVPGSKYISVVSDPAGVIDASTGLPRRVLKLTTPDNAGDYKDSGARAQLETKPIMQDDHDYWIGWSVYLPTDFPNYGTKYFTHGLSGGFGTNAKGPSPLRVDIGNRTSTQSEIKLGRSGTYDFERLWTMPQPVADLKGRWIDVVEHVNSPTAPKAGYLEIWTNPAPGWTRATFPPPPKSPPPPADGHRVYYKTSDPATDGTAPFDHRILNYYTYGSYKPLGYDAVTLYQGPHRIGTSFNAVDPHSHG